MDWNKDHIRETMLLLETAALHSARENGTVANSRW